MSSVYIRPIFFYSIVAALLILGGCNGTGGAGTTGSSSGGHGSSMTAQDTIPPGDKRCPAGGVEIFYGIDDNGDGVLEEAERNGSEVICNGAAGASGESTIVLQSAIAVGDATCPAGGIEISSGIDANGNGTLDADEISGSQVICNGSTGSTGSAGKPTIVSQVAIPVGDATCPAGGVRLFYGVDDDGNGTLSSAERDGSLVVCYGAQGDSGTPADQAPSAVVSSDPFARVGATVLLDGSGSTDPEGEALTYRWTVLAAPSDSAAVLDNVTAAQPSFVPDVAGDYQFVLRVTDTHGNSSTSRVVTLQAADWVVSSTEPGAFSSVQDAVDWATSGERILVRAGTYAGSLQLDKGIELVGEDPDTTTIEGQITVSASGVTIRNLGVTNPTGADGILVSGIGGVNVLGNRIVNVGTDASFAGTAEGIYIADLNTTQAISAITIAGNVIDGVGNGQSGTNKGIFVGDSHADVLLSGLTISRNTIKNVVARSDKVYASGGRGAYGILINWGASGAHDGTVEKARLIGNDISDLSGYWVHAIGLEGPTPSAYVANNVVSGLTSTKGYVDGEEVVLEDPTQSLDSVGVFFEANADAASVLLRGNRFSKGLPYGVAVHPDLIEVLGAESIDATVNWWGDASGPDGAGSGVSSNVDYGPWCTQSDCSDIISLSIQ